MNHESAGHKAARALSERLPMRCKFVEGTNRDEDRLELLEGEMLNATISLRCVTLMHLRPTHIEHIAAQLGSFPDGGILLTNYANPSITKALTSKGINFFDLSGNCRIHTAGFYFAVDGLKPVKEDKPTSNKAFELAGMKLILALLSGLAPITASYRDLAQAAGISLGTVGPALDGLDGAGFIMHRDKPAIRKLINKKKLLERWVETFTEKIKPKLFVGNYELDNHYLWKEINLADYGGYWGGEVGAEILTNYIKPQVFTIYINAEKRSKLFAAARIRKADPMGNNQRTTVEVYEKFGPDYPAFSSYPHDVVNPIIVYADLIGTHDSRNLDVAQAVYDSRLDQFISED